MPVQNLRHHESKTWCAFLLSVPEQCLSLLQHYLKENHLIFFIGKQTSERLLQNKFLRNSGWDPNCHRLENDILAKRERGLQQREFIFRMFFHPSALGCEKVCSVQRFRFCLYKRKNKSCKGAGSAHVLTWHRRHCCCQLRTPHPSSST